MAKQTVDKKTKEMPLLETWPQLETTRENIIKLGTLLDHLQVEYSEIKRQMVELETAGINYAGTTYRDNKYLYLVYPVQDDGSRKREYVGANPEKIKTELDKLKRGEEYDKLEKKESRIENKIYQCGWATESEIRKLEW